jgi:hypothetical protein
MKKLSTILSLLASFGIFIGLARAGEPRHDEFLRGRVEVEIRNGVYSYKIINADPDRMIGAFHLDIKNVPITVTGPVLL